MNHCEKTTETFSMRLLKDTMFVCEFTALAKIFVLKKRTLAEESPMSLS